MRRRHPASVPDDRPFALVGASSRGLLVTALERKAAAEGLRADMALADARAALPGLATATAEPERDRAALVRLARWCGRYGPARNAVVLPAASALTSLDHGLWIDVAGVEHLYGGESSLLADIAARLARMGLTVRIGLADTSGAAYALARYVPRSCGNAAAAVAAPGATAAAVAALPVEALRLEPAAVLLLRRLGLNRIGQLYGLPRAALERRFRDAAAAGGRLSKAHRPHAGQLAGTLLARLDEVLGTRLEVLEPLAEPPALAVRRAYAEPFRSGDFLEAEVERLAAELCVALDGAGLGARHVRLSLYRADGTTAEADVATSAPTRDPRHLMRLMRERLAAIDAGFGIDALAVEAVRAAPSLPLQEQLSGGAQRAESLAELVDRLANRLGPGRVARLGAVASHVPERAEKPVCALHACGPEPAAARERQALSPHPPRPPLLLARPEPIEVMAEVPEGAPLRFTWRRLTVRVARAEGPERIAPEWWRDIAGSRLPGPAQETETAQDAGAPPPRRPRDYYRIEAEGGGGYWVFRHGLYADPEAAGPPRWFLHGLYG